MNDLHLTNGGSLYVLRATSDTGREWIEAHVSQAGFQPAFPEVIYIEARYVGSLVDGAIADGLEAAL